MAPCSQATSPIERAIPAQPARVCYSRASGLTGRQIEGSRTLPETWTAVLATWRRWREYGGSRRNSGLGRTRGGQLLPADCLSFAKFIANGVILRLSAASGAINERRCVKLRPRRHNYRLGRHGKTYSLVSEIRAAIEQGLAPDRLLATTFTKKAAAELAGRIRTALIDANRPELAAASLAARIGTVTAFAARLSVSSLSSSAGRRLPTSLPRTARQPSLRAPPDP